jgi:hypothetical protein
VVFVVDTSVDGVVAAYAAPPANDKAPAAPNTGIAFLRRFCFEASVVCDISTVLLSVEHIVRWAMQRNSIPTF